MNPIEEPRSPGYIYAWRESIIPKVEQFFKTWSIGQDNQLTEFLDSLWKTFPKSEIPFKERQIVPIYIPNSPYIGEYWFRPVQMSWRTAILSYAILPPRILVETQYTYMFFQNQSYLKQVVASFQLGNVNTFHAMAMWCATFGLKKTKLAIDRMVETRLLMETHPIIRGLFTVLIDTPGNMLEEMRSEWNNPYVRYMYMITTGEYHFDDIHEHYSAICLSTNCCAECMEEMKHPYAPLVNMKATNKKQYKALGRALRERGSVVLANAYLGDYVPNHGYSKNALKKLDQNIAVAIDTGYKPPRDFTIFYHIIAIVVLFIAIMSPILMI